MRSKIYLVKVGHMIWMRHLDQIRVISVRFQIPNHEDRQSSDVNTSDLNLSHFSQGSNVSCGFQDDNAVLEGADRVQKSSLWGGRLRNNKK